MADKTVEEATAQDTPREAHPLHASLAKLRQVLHNAPNLADPARAADAVRAEHEQAVADVLVDMDARLRSIEGSLSGGGADAGTVERSKAVSELLSGLDARLSAIEDTLDALAAGPPAAPDKPAE